MRAFHLPKAVLAAILLLACPLAAPAQKAGYDLLQTRPGASVDLGSVPGFSPSKIPLKGVPICSCTGATDTIMYRTKDVPRGGGSVPLSVVALFLKNSGAVTFNGRPVDVYITINRSHGMIGQDVLPQPDPLPESLGTLTVRTNGTFDSTINVLANVILVPPGSDVTNPANHLSHRPAPAATLTSANSPWKRTPPADYPTSCFFPGNGFYPGGPIPEKAPTHAHPVAPTQTGATNLKIVKVAAPAINCVFNSTCKVTVSDTVADIPLPGISGKAVLQSRTFDGQPGTPAAGLKAYEYRVNLTQAVGVVNIPCIASLTVDFGPVSSLPYGGAGSAPAQVFVTTKGGLGTIAPVSAVQSGRNVTFNFQPSVCAGGAPGTGDTTFFFGLASAKPPRAITAITAVAGGGPLNVGARAPQP
jgi:hypothetical protein